MKIAMYYIITLTLLLVFSEVASAANIEGHLQYRIVSYSFSSDDPEFAKDSVTFGPLLITGVTSDIITDIHSRSDSGTSDPKSATDIFAVSAAFSASDDLSLHGAIGIAKNRWDATFDPEYDSSWEANLGVIYTLFNNINYEIHFGYMETGDLFKESNTYTDVESIVMISNKLTMSF